MIVQKICKIEVIVPYGIADNMIFSELRERIANNRLTNDQSLCCRPESFQLQMVFSFPFLRANNLRSSLLNIRARNFLLLCT